MVKLLLQASRQSYSPFLCNARLMDPNWVGKDGSPAVICTVGMQQKMCISGSC